MKFCQCAMEMIETGDFIEESIGAQLKTLLAVNIVAELREDDDLGREGLRLERPQDFQPIHPGHAEVEDHQVGPEADQGFQGLVSVLGFADHGETAHGVEQTP